VSVDIPVADRKTALDRANANRANESRMLCSFGCMITFAVTTDEALGALRSSAEQLRACRRARSALQTGQISSCTLSWTHYRACAGEMIRTAELTAVAEDDQTIRRQRGQRPRVARPWRCRSALERRERV